MLRDATSGREVSALPRPSSLIFSLAWAPDSKRQATGILADEGRGRRAKITIWDTATAKEQDSWTDSEECVPQALAWSPDGRRLLSGRGPSKGFCAWDVAGKQQARIMGPGSLIAPSTGSFESVAQRRAWSPDGRWLACSGSPGVIRLWDVQTGKEALPLPGHAQDTHSLAWSPDGRWLLSNVDAHGGKVWDVAKREEVVLP